MPIIDIKTNYELKQQEQLEIMRKVIRSIAKQANKPISRVMCFIEVKNAMMNESIAPMMLVTIRCINELEEHKKRKVCSGLLEVIKEHMPIDEGRVYINFIPINEDCAWQFSQGEAVCAAKVKV